MSEAPLPVPFDPWASDPGNARAINAFAIEFVMRFVREAGHLFDHDYLTALIFLSIVEGNGRQNVREPEILQQYADLRRTIPADNARPMSRQAIAESLGLPRETVRRKIAALIHKGFLVEDPRGGVISARGVLADDRFVAAGLRVVNYVRQFRSDLRRYAGQKGD